MIKKIFAYVASPRNQNSNTMKVTHLLIDNLTQVSNYDYTYKFFTPTDKIVSLCKGCNNCFINGKCTLKDDMEKIKIALANADIVIFASPVYLAQVTGQMKVFLDRLAYWIHILKLTGKLAINISVSDSNNNEHVNEYLHKVMSFMGMSVVADISVRMAQYNYSDIESLNKTLFKEADKINRIISKGLYPIDTLQEKYFLSMKDHYANLKNDITYEKKYWIEKGYFNHRTFSSLFLNLTKW